MLLAEAGLRETNEFKQVLHFGDVAIGESAELFSQIQEVGVASLLEAGDHLLCAACAEVHLCQKLVHEFKGLAHVMSSLPVADVISIHPERELWQGKNRRSLSGFCAIYDYIAN